MTVPSPTSLEEYRFFHVAMFLLRRLPRDAANFLDISCGYKQTPYREGWNIVRRSGPGPSVFWVYISADGSRVTTNAPDINHEDIQEISFPFEKLGETVVWKWFTNFSSQHSQTGWAQNLVNTISRIEQNFDDPPSQGQIEAALKLAQFELLVEGRSTEAQPKAIFELLLRKYLALEVAGEIIALILAHCLGNLGTKSARQLDGTLRLRQEFVEFVDKIIEDRRGQPPRAFGLMTHVASLYGFIAMKLSMQLRSDFVLPSDVGKRLSGSDAYVDERLVSDVQTHTIEAASPSGDPVRNREILEDLGSRDASETDVYEMLRQRYWPNLSET